MLAAHGRHRRAPSPTGRSSRPATPRCAITVAADVGGLALADPPLLLLADRQLFGARARQERRRRRAQADPAAILRDLQNLDTGAPVVHESYGVGRYVGLQAHAGRRRRRRVPGDRIPRRRPHLRAGARAAPGQPLHRRRARGRAAAQARHRPVGQGAPRAPAKQVRDVAAELLDLYARRQARRAAR